MQTQAAVEGLHNCRVLILIKYFSKIIRQMKETNEGKFFIETDFVDTRSFFLPANQKARLTAYNQSKFA